MVINNLAKNQQNTADNLIGTTDKDIILKKSSEQFKAINGPEKIIDRTLSGVDGVVVGIDPWNEVGVMTVGAPDNTDVLIAVVNYDNRYLEYFTTTVYKDTSNTTATWNGDGELSFDGASFEEAYSEIIFKDDKNVFKVTITAIGTNTENLSYFISSDNGTTYEQISLGVTTNLSVNDKNLRFKITNGAPGGSGWPTPFGTWGSTGGTVTAAITKLIIEYGV